MYIYQFLTKNTIFQKQIISKILLQKNYLVTSTIRYIDASPNFDTDTKNLKPQNTHLNINELIDKYETSILYNSVIEDEKLKIGFRKNKAIEQKLRKEHQQRLLKLQSSQPLPVSLKYLNEIKTTKDKFVDTEETEANITQFPFESYEKIVKSDQGKHVSSEQFNSAENEVLERYSRYDPTKNWMSDYENYDDLDTGNNVKYGTPDPKSKVSNVPCGGCGSLLHCKDTSIPGYIPSEIFKSHRKEAGQNLRSIICQRCHFLQHYNMALQVRVSPADYPIILRTINDNMNALVILMVDLLDFPCSIWPNIIDIIGRERPVIIVGNKIDLLPQDSRGYLARIQDILIDNIEQFGLSKANIQHVALISAKTGYGVEELITKLHNIWKYQGDVYLVGCTNVGKSTLFNALLQSDYCKIKAVDLVQRATTSIWPGTTLNLLKFPILRPSGWRLFVRAKRLISLNKIKSQEHRLRKIQLQKTNNPKYATLMGHIEQTFTATEPVDEEDKDMFTIQGHGNASGKTKIGINEKEPQYRLSKWCYDTPGVVQPDQILHLLTTEELMLTLPKQLIQPRTYSIKSGSTIFIAGLGRLDFIQGPESIRVTVFASATLPVTICAIEIAEKIYNGLLGTELFKVPFGDKDRLQKWPQLIAGDEIKLNGVAWTTACADIVLSSAGWISVSLGPEMHCKLQPWTPEKRGIFVRGSILAKAVTLRGRRIRFSPAYRKSHFYNE